MLHLARAASLLLLAAFLSGCGRTGHDLEPISYEQWQRQIPAAHEGRVLVVPVWATWCRTCLDLLPAIIELSGKYQRAGVDFAGLCVDDADDRLAIENAQGLVRELEAPFGQYLLQSEISKTLAWLDLAGIPAVLVYDAEGQLRFRLEGDDPDNEIAPADLEDAIESLL